MKRIFAAVALPVALFAFVTVLSVVSAPLPTGSALSYGTAPNVSFAAPKKASADNVGIGRIAASSLDGSADILAVAGTLLQVEYNPSFYGDFSTLTLDSSDSIGNQVAHHGADGRIWGEWFHGYSDGTADIISALKNPGSGGGSFADTTIPGSHGLYKVTDEAIQPGTNRVYALWARNDVGARIAYSDDGTHWSAPEDVPGPFSANAADFGLGVTSNGVVAVGWFERSPADDVFVQMKGTNGLWGPVTDVAPLAGQGYGPRFAGDSNGGLRIVWDQVTSGERDPWYREWTPGGGWGAMVQLCNTPGDTSGGAYNISTDLAGTAHIVYGDDSIAPGDQQSFYVEGRGTSFSVPQPVVPQYGSASSRFPDIDVNSVGGSVIAHVVLNSNVGGSFANYYTYATLSAPTPTPQPTPCTPGVFSDVSPSNPFYGVVTDLVSKGAISGYNDCTFRPYNTITRGQAAKVLVLGFGLPINTTGGPHFSDVAVGSTFYPYVETAYNRGIISGYSDGTFRPNANVTRAQISKMAAIGRGWALVNPSTPTFTDVPASNPFYQVIETAYSKGVISGYTCGTGCRQFRPNNTATRGQGAKIIDLAIYATLPTVPH
ncbi:MAG: S-layer homology domain-containing protein [Chloroflexia bacterium]